MKDEKDTTPEETPEPVLPLPEDFDLDAWMSGVRSTVRSVTIYQRGDLLAEIEETERQIQLAGAPDAEEFGMEDAGAGAEVLNARLDAAYKALLASGVTFKVEARSNDWLEDIHSSVTQASEGRSLTKEERLSIANMRQLAGAIIEPQGVTYEHLKGLEQASGAQYRKLLAAFFQANAVAPVVTAPTSPASSARHGGRGRK